MSRNIKLLLVEDNPGDAHLFRLALQESDREKFSLKHAFSLEEAKKEISETDFDIVMLDLSLPDSQGLETVREILETDNSLPVVVLTGSEDETIAIQAVQLGAQDYLKKGSISNSVLVRSMLYAIERHRLRAELEEMNRTRNNLFSIISHDLKSPFYSMVQVVKHIVDNYDGFDRATLKQHLKVIGTTTEKLYDLVENLLQWAGSQTGRIAVQPSTVRLRELADNVIGILNENAELKNIALVNIIPDGITCWADRNMIHTVLRNLVSNGIKFTHTGGTVTVFSEYDENSITVHVQDTGTGMSRENMEKLFLTESRSSRTGTAGETGTGLGLLVCREFVEKNGGEINVSSTENKGTIFSFSVPRTASVSADPASKARG